MLSGHPLLKGRTRVTLVQCSLILTHILPSLAISHQNLSHAGMIEDHTLENGQNYQHFINHLIRRKHAVQRQNGVVSVSLVIVKE